MTENEHSIGYSASTYDDVRGLSRDRPYLLPSNRKLRHLQGISLRNLTLSRQSSHTQGKTFDDTSLPYTLKTPTKALAQREAHKLEHSRSSNDLKSPPSINGSIRKKGEGVAESDGSPTKKLRPANHKLRRRSTLNWTNALPEARQKKLENVAAERLADTWFSIHCSNIEKPIYISEVVDRAMNASYRFFDINTFGPWVTRKDELTVKLWARTANTKDFSMLIELQVHLRSLQFIGKTLENFRHPLPPNCILFHLSDGIYTSFTDLPQNESLVSPSKPFRSVPQSVQPTSSFDALMRLSNLDDCIQDALVTREKLAKQISAILEEQKEPRSMVTSASLASESLASTNRSLTAARKALRTTQSRQSDLQASLRARREAIASGTLAQEKASSNLGSAREVLSSRASLHRTTQVTLQGQIRRITEDLLQIYPIEAIPDKPLNFTICGIPLPNATAITASDTDPVCLAAALGHATHLTHLLSFYLSTSLPYPPSPQGSTSTIYDPVSTTLHSPQARTFPLYSKGAVQFRFEYGAFLLNSDIETLMCRQGIKLVDQRHTAGNLKMLLSILTAGKGDTPERKKGALKGLTQAEQERSSSRERSDIEEWDISVRRKGYRLAESKQVIHTYT